MLLSGLNLQVKLCCVCRSNWHFWKRFWKCYLPAVAPFLQMPFFKINLSKRKSVQQLPAPCWLKRELLQSEGFPHLVASKGTVDFSMAKRSIILHTSCNRVKRKCLPEAGLAQGQGNGPDSVIAPKYPG